MKIKPAKSWSLSIRKGMRRDRIVFMIPLLLEQPIRTLGRDCTADLSDKQVVRLVEKQLAHSLSKTDSSQLPVNLSCGATVSNCFST